VDGLYLIIRSFADVEIDRALAVARVFDAHPGLRPLKVGGDPARLKVEPSMEAVVAEHGLPIDWLTVRRNGRYPDFEGGQIHLLDGRGAWMGTPVDWAAPEEIGGSHHIGDHVYHLVGHGIEQYWRPETVQRPGAVDEVASLFEELVLALDAAYGYVVAESRRPDGLRSLIDRELPGVFWLNYFGPAFRDTHPRLRHTSGTRSLVNGGVIVRTTDVPWQPVVPDVSEWQSGLRHVFGDAAFRFVKPRNTALPSIEEHLAASPGRTEMPWVAHLARKAVDGRAKKYAAARKRLGSALAGRDDPELGTGQVEWSTSFDVDDFLAFFAHLRRRLGGELSKPIGTALRSVIANAPLDEEDSVVLVTEVGAIRFGWFIDDIDTVDLFALGPEAVRDACEAWFA
jgi:hypothetical protein